MTNVEAYQEKLKSPKWQKKRLKILERDNWVCQNCIDDTATLHVHHLKYFGGDPWEVPDEYLVTLCERCHKREEELKDADLFDLVEGTGLTRVHIKILLQWVKEIMMNLPEARRTTAVEFRDRILFPIYQSKDKLPK